MSMAERRRMLLATLGGGTPLSDLPEESILKIPEGGVLTDFYVAKHDYESGLNGAGRTLLVRKYLYGETKFGYYNAYADDYLDVFLNDTYKSNLSTKVKNAIGTTSFYYTKGRFDMTVTTLSRSIFELSSWELSGVSADLNYEGSILPIANTLVYGRTENDIAAPQWTRSPKSNTAVLAAIIDEYGNLNAGVGTTKLNYARPAFTLPADVSCKPNADGSYTLLL